MAYDSFTAENPVDGPSQDILVFILDVTPNPAGLAGGQPGSHQQFRPSFFDVFVADDSFFDVFVEVEPPANNLTPRQAHVMAYDALAANDGPMPQIAHGDTVTGKTITLDVEPR